MIGAKLRSREIESQITETNIAIKSLNRMTALDRAVFERVS
ncbi:hypothetical protein METH_22695 (plasmid) [Leisingera methylohalidivorans DSM 14336]|uniref:Transposase n=1 Tax=Leisingera methylohalidivorans DSM 14336 TaxID=999552 RepID=V9VY25_9RHOB|nr:hypothetical protein METH_22695 [Leisingera methylohalidivorans DSM 14336]